MLEKIKRLISLINRNFIKNKCILVIEDNKLDSTLLLSILNKKYSKVLIAENAMIGLEMVKTDNPDLIVLDYNLPDMQGGDVLSKLKGDDKTKQIPVIVLTAEGTPNNICESYSNEADGFLLKPIDREVLIYEINKNLRKA